MLGGDVPWEGSSRRVVSLQAPCHVKFTCVHGDKVQPSCPRETKSRLPRCAFPPLAIVGRDDHLDWLSTSSPKPRARPHTPRSAPRPARAERSCGSGRREAGRQADRQWAACLADTAPQERRGLPASPQQYAPRASGHPRWVQRLSATTNLMKSSAELIGWSSWAKALAPSLCVRAR